MHAPPHRRRNPPAADRDGERRSSAFRSTQLTVTDGVVHGVADTAKRVSYAELIGGRYLDKTVKWNGRLSNGLQVEVPAPLKKPADFKIIGQSLPRKDLPGKVFGTLEMVNDVRLPGMLHARMIRPTVAGAVPVKVDEGSIKHIPGARRSGSRTCSPSSPRRNGTRSRPRVR